MSTECTEIVLPAVTVEVRELGTGRPLADSVTGIAQTGDNTVALRADLTPLASQVLANRRTP